MPEDVLQDALSAATAAGDRRLVGILVFGAYAGLRRGEIAKLQRRDVTARGLRIVGKGGVTWVVPLHPQVVDALAWLPDRGYLFPGQIDGHIAPDTVAHLVTSAIGGGWTTHSLRHRFASQAYAGTTDLRTLQELSGHSKPETTARYTAVATHGLAEAVLSIA